MSERRLPVTAILCASLFLIGISSAAVAPYRAIAAIEGLGMSNSVFALVVTLGSVGTALASLVLGYFADRIPDRRLLVVGSASMGALTYGLIYLFPTPLTYILAFCLLFPFGGALFSQTFSFSRAYYDLRRPQRAQFMMSVLRTLFSVAWVVVPPAAGWIASTRSVFAVFAAAALALVGCTLIFGLLFLDSGARAGSAGGRGPGSTPVGWHILPHRLVGIGGVTLVRVALALHLMVVPLAIVRDFGGTLKDVGINASLAAGLEVPFMLAWGLAAARLSKEAILVLNSLIYALYLVLLFRAHSVREVLWLQSLNAVATAALLCITISYMQEAIKGRVGLSTALMDVVTVVSTLIASATFAALSSRESYVAVFAAASLLSLVGAGTIALSGVPRLWGSEGLLRPDRAD